MNEGYMSLEAARKIVQLETNYKSMQDSALQLNKIVNGKQVIINKNEELLNNIKKIIYNDKITGIEAKLMIKDLFEKENK